MQPALWKDERFDALEAQVNGLDRRLAIVESRLDEMTKSMDRGHDVMLGLQSSMESFRLAVLGLIGTFGVAMVGTVTAVLTGGAP